MDTAKLRGLFTREPELWQKLLDMEQKNIERFADGFGAGKPKYFHGKKSIFDYDKQFKKEQADFNILFKRED